MNQKKQKGFTLVELLVVIAIIGILAAVVIVSLNSARVKARDARRQADLTNLQAALELYNDSQNQYPNQNCTGAAADPANALGAAGTTCDTAFNGMITDLKNEGLLQSDGPIDPRTPTPGTNVAGANNEYYYGYDVGNSGNAYQLRYYSEGDSAAQTLP